LDLPVASGAPPDFVDDDLAYGIVLALWRRSSSSMEGRLTARLTVHSRQRSGMVYTSRESLYESA